METELEFDMEAVPSNDRLKITVEDLHSKNVVTTFVDNYSEDSESLDNASHTAFNKAYKTLMEGDMNDPKKAEQDQDLKHQKPEESDNLNKSESPDSEYMKDRGLDRETHGKVN